MKKLIILTSLLLAIGINQSKAAIASQVVLAQTMTNIPTALPGNSLKISQLIVTPPAAAAGTNSFQLYDTPTNTTVYAVGPYTNILFYATNLIVSWTNYYGRTNSWTNLSLVDYTNSVALQTNNYPLMLQALLPTNTTVTYPNLGITCIYGAWVTNTGTLPITINMTYTQ